MQVVLPCTYYPNLYKRFRIEVSEGGGTGATLRKMGRNDTYYAFTLKVCHTHNTSNIMPDIPMFIIIIII